MMKKIECPFFPFINNYDCIGWVPTIRGALSLSVFDDIRQLWGDVDKYAVEFKTYSDNKNTQWYLLASSLITFDDSKGGWSRNIGWHYSRTFRFIFRGFINDIERQKQFIKDFIGNEKPDEGLFRQKELLIGKLSIVANLSNKISEPIKNLLLNLKELTTKKNDYKMSVINGFSFTELESLREKMKEDWEIIEKEIIQIENSPDENSPIFTFDMVLSRDGILFLKDVTCETFRKSYFKEGTADDFTKNVPIHRLFKIAFNFVKFLFHKNYHHSEANDTFLPVTNLHRIKSETTLYKVIRDQIEAFQSPVIKIKRNINTVPKTCDPKGVLLYAQSFLLIFKKNKFISDETASLHHEFIEKQIQEFEFLQSDYSIIRNSFLSQKNSLATITAGFAFLIVAKHTFDLLYDKNLFCLDAIELFKFKLIIVVSSIIIGVYTHWIVVDIGIAKGKYNKKEKPKNVLNKNSSIKKGKLSFLYRIRLSWINIKHLIGRLNIYRITFVALLLFLLGLLLFLYYFL